MKSRKWPSRFGMVLVIAFSLVACKVIEDKVDGVVKLTDCFEGQDSAAIVAGEVVSYSDPAYKLVTMLKIQRPAHSSICTGTLISDRVILTAAHCVSGVGPTDVTANFVSSMGCSMNQQKKAGISADSIVIHPEFDGSPQSLADLALVFLKTEVPRDQQRVPLIERGENASDDRVLLLGFGITGEAQTDSRTLRRVYKSLNTDLTFRERAIYVDQAKTPGGFCRGDSGAPILVENSGKLHILGVNSANIGTQADNECHTMSVAMNMNYFADWIHQEMSLFSSDLNH